MKGRNGRWGSVVVAAAMLFATRALATGDVSDGSCTEDVATTNPVAAVAELVTKPINPVCEANPNSKLYPNGQGNRTWYGAKKVDVRCQYTCTSENFPTITVEATRTVTFFGDGDTALSCYGVIYEQRYNNYAGWFVYVPTGTKKFSPAKADVRELKDWAEGKPWGR